MSETTPSRMRGIIGAGVVLAGILVLVVAFSGGFAGSAGGREGASGSAWLDLPAPSAVFTSLDGGDASLDDYRGKVVILNLWGTWCPPCRREIPELVELQEELLERDATVVSIAVDSGAEKSIRSFAAEFGIDYPIWLGSTDEAVRHFKAIGFPYTLLIDREGVVRKQYLGPQSRETLLADAEVWIAEGSRTETPTYIEASEAGS